MSDGVTIFDRVIGHGRAKEALAGFLEGENTPHALLFSGPAAVGKLALARELASALLIRSLRPGESKETATARVARGEYPDLHFVTLEEDKRDISVDQIRELLSRLALRPYSSHASVAIINDAHLMTAGASNALLKTLEEPNPEVFLLLVTSAPQRLLETVLSRCQRVAFGTLATGDLERVISNAIPDIDNGARSTLVSLCDGSLEALAIERFYDARTGTINDLKALTEHIESLATRAGETKAELERLFSPRKRADAASLLSLASKFAEDPERLPERFLALRSFFRSRLLIQTGDDAARSGERLLIVMEAERLVRERNLNPALTISNLMLQLSALDTARKVG